MLMETYLYMKQEVHIIDCNIFIKKVNNFFPDLQFSVCRQSLFSPLDISSVIKTRNNNT